MFKSVVFTALLASSFGAVAADWQQEFFTPITNELAPSRGVAVDEQGYVHLQAFNRTAGSNQYTFAHAYTIGASGLIPWTWGLSQVDRMSDCGVYAKAGQRLDCFRRNGFLGEETRLEMRANNNGNIVWQTSLPGSVAVLNAAIQQPNTALVLGRIEAAQSAQGVTQLAVFRANSIGPAVVLSVTPVCPSAGQKLVLLRSYVPKQASERIRVLKTCWDGIGTSDLTLDEFNPQTN